MGLVGQNKVIRVLVVDDSPLVRQILVTMLESEPGFVIVGEAADGVDASRQAARLRPDVITMDIRMPRLDGLGAIKQIMSTVPTPIVVVTSSVYDSELDVAFRAIEAGALTVVEKPKGLSPSAYEAVRDQLVTTVRLMSDVQVVTIRPTGQTTGQAMRDAESLFWAEANIKLIAIGSSTGGPGILRQILSALPGDMSIPIVIVQHITPNFSQGFAHWLDSATELQVSLAQEAERVAPGRVLIAPEHAHLLIRPGGFVRLDRSPPVQGLRPSASVLFDSVAKAYGDTAVGVILTGMGEDGADGLQCLREAGGYVLAQNEASCVIFGMPKAAIDRGIVDRVLPPDEIASTLRRLNQLVKSKQPA
jgi:two-component system chemotaxis response regulator CheB